MIDRVENKLLKATVLLFPLAVFMLSSLSADDLDLKAQELILQAKLDDTLKEYAILSEEITANKMQLVAPLNNKRLSVSKLRGETDMLLLRRSEKLNSLERIEGHNTDLAKQIDFIDALIIDHLSNFDTLIHASEDQRYRPRFSELRSAKKPDVSRENQIIAQLAVLDFSFDRIYQALGGYTFEGQAVNESGDVLDGKITLVGPNSYFVGNNNNGSGQLQVETNSLIPTIAAVPDISVQQIEGLSNGELTRIPIDITLGRAKDFLSSKWTLNDHVEKGGRVGNVIMGFAAIAVLIVLIKIFDLSKVRGLNSISMADILERRSSLGNEAALEEAEQKPYPANRVLSAALKYADHDTNVIEEVVVGEIQTVKTRLERLLPFLAITAATAPLMGLLGTVVGMIKTFSLITVFGSGNAQSFSAGISEALITTEFGLVVAIPTLIVHGVLLRSAREKIGSLEDLASEFVISLQELKHRVPQ